MTIAQFKSKDLEVSISKEEIPPRFNKGTLDIPRCCRCTGYYSIVITMPEKERCSGITNLVGRRAKRNLVVTQMVPRQNLQKG